MCSKQSFPEKLTINVCSTWKLCRKKSASELYIGVSRYHFMSCKDVLVYKPQAGCFEDKYWQLPLKLWAKLGLTEMVSEVPRESTSLTLPFIVHIRLEINIPGLAFSAWQLHFQRGLEPPTHIQSVESDCSRRECRAEFPEWTQPFLRVFKKTAQLL